MNTLKATKTKKVDFGSKSNLRPGPVIVKGKGVASEVYTKELAQNRAKYRENHLKDFPTEEAYNKWADYLYNYQAYTGKELTFPAPIQSEGLGSLAGGVAKSSGRIALRALPNIFRQAANFEGPIIITPYELQEPFRNRAYPSIFRNLTPAQIQQYTFGQPHNGEFKEGTGTLADYIQNGGDLTNPDVAPFVELFSAETAKKETGAIRNIAAPNVEDIPEIPLEQKDVPVPEPPVEQKVDAVPRSQVWTDMWKTQKSKPAGGQSRNGAWRNEFNSVLDGESVPDRNSPEYPTFLDKIREKFYKTPRGATVAILNAIPTTSAPASVSSSSGVVPVQPSAPVIPGNVPIVDAGLNLPAQIPSNVPVAPRSGAITRAPAGGPPEPSRGPGGQVARGGRPIVPRTRRVIPLVPPYVPNGPDEPKPNDPRRRPPKDKKEPDKPDQKDVPVVDETPDVDKAKLQSGDGYGYLRPEFSIDTGAESLILSNKQQLQALTQWDNYDAVYDSIYTSDNTLYTQQLKRDKARFSGIAKDPYFYLGAEYKKHLAKDPIRIYATQGSMHNSNNLMTALGQVKRNAFNNVGPRDRGLAFRKSPDFQTDMFQRLYEDPDMEAQIEYKVNFDDNIDDVKNLISAMKGTHAVTLMNRWTTETSGMAPINDKEINSKTLKMEI